MRRQLGFAALAAALLVGLSTDRADATIYLMEDFSTYTDGDLVGQNGWTQRGGTSSAPIQVSGGSVVMPAPAGINQDAYINNSAGTIPAPGVGTTTVYMGYKMSVQSAPTVDFTSTTPSYFSATYTGDDASGFANERIFTSASGSGFVFSAKVTGQAAAPFGTGVDVLSFNTDYNVIVRADMVAGPGNDTVSIYVNPTSGDVNLETPYVTVGVGGGSDPAGIGSLVLSQFEIPGAVLQSAVTIHSIVMADTFAEASMIPEPSSFLLAGMAGVIGLGYYRVRRRRR
ncbi:MAG: PEP-CTERM sorting domain-containing protein [Planctomycetota bacterium]|nr:MAG: PEP-CTERM sorting domain-containing protein [Planctomycetota bacterium]